MSLSTWGSQTDVRPTQSPSTASTQGGGRRVGWGSYTVLQGTWTQANGREDRLGRWGGGTISYCQASEGNFSFTLSLYNLLTFGVRW